jgi:sulfide:quinone oxidoreductase
MSGIDSSAVENCDIVIVGGGSAGITVAARLTKALDRPDITIIEPSLKHYYQPLWTLVGSGVMPKEVTVKNESTFIPSGVKWVQDTVTDFDPENNNILTQAGRKISYNQLVVALGIQLDWQLIEGLKENLGKNGVCSNYTYNYVDKTWEFIANFEAGNAIFTYPNTLVKCSAAAQKIMYLAEHYFRKSKIRDQAQVIFATADTKLFPVPKYAATLSKIVITRGINVKFQHNLIEIRGDKKEAVFQKLDTGETVVFPYSIIHVTPPQSAPDCIKHSQLANVEGWVDVDKYTLQHRRYPNIFSLGDASSLPTSKTGAAVRKQAPILVENLLALREGKPLLAQYDGYTSCPIITGYGRLVLTEFDYDKNPKETFPFDQAQERFSMYFLKRYVLPLLYWHGMLRGRL